MDRRRVGPKVAGTILYALHTCTYPNGRFAPTLSGKPPLGTNLDEIEKPKEVNPPSDSGKELCLLNFVTEAPKDNRWQADGRSDKQGFDKLALRANVEVPLDELRKTNPDLPESVLEMKLGGSYKLRHPTTGEVDSDWSLDKVKESTGTAKLTRTYKIDVQHKDDHTGLIERMAGVPESFADDLQKKLDELPKNVLANLDKAGYKIIAATTIPNAMPTLDGLTPRGWPKKMTFENSDGTHDNMSKRIIAPMRFKPGDEWEPVFRPEVLVHQVGHAVDFANGFLSASKPFKDAYTEDMARVIDTRNPVLKYLSQPGGIGRQETFAALFGMALTGPENEHDRHLLEKTFPRTIEVVKDQIRALK